MSFFDVTTSMKNITETLDLSFHPKNDMFMSRNIFKLVQSEYFSNPKTKVKWDSYHFKFNRRAARAIEMAMYTNDKYPLTFATPMMLEILGRLT